MWSFSKNLSTKFCDFENEEISGEAKFLLTIR